MYTNKYMGVHLFRNGRFITCMKCLVQLSKKELFALRIFKFYLPFECQLKVFDKTVVPILTYGCEKWVLECWSDGR